MGIRRAVACAACVAVAALPTLARADRAISGTVVDAHDGAPIAGAEVTAGGIEVVSDGDGAWTASGVPTGGFDVFVLAEGFEPYLGRGRAGQELRIRLDRDQNGGEVVQIQGTAPVTAEPARQLGAAEIHTLPGSGNDALRALQSLPGVARIPFGVGGLALRGSAPRDSHVFLDGIQVPILYHFGGLASFVPTSFLSDIELEPGSFGAQHGRGLGGVAIVGSRAGRADRWREGGEISLLDAAATAEGPGPARGSWLMGVRRSYADAFLGFLPIDLTLIPRYADAQLRWESGSGRWTVLAFGSDDSLHLVRTPTGDNSGVNASSLAAFDYLSRFVRLGVRYKDTLGAGPGAPTLTVTPSIGLDRISAVANNKGTDKGEARTDLVASTRAELVAPIDHGTVSVGTDAIVTQYDWDVNDVPPTLPGQPPGNNTVVDRKGSRAAADLGFWLETRWSTDDESVGVRPGVRVDYFGLAEQWTVDPRLTVTHRGPGCTTISESIGMYHQGPSIVDYDPIFGDRKLSASWATQASIGVKGPLRDLAELSVTAYAADLHELPVDVVTGATPVSANGSVQSGGLFGIARELIDDQFGSYSYRRNVGRGAAAGIETMIRRDVGDVTGWVSYTYARSFRQGDPETNPPWLPYVLDQPHLFTAVASWRAGDHWRFGARLRFSSGNPYTPVLASFLPPDHKDWVVIDGPILSQRLPPFAQLDLRFDRTWIRKWGRIVGFLDLQNVSNRANPEGVTYNEDYTRRSYTLGLPIFPSFGVEYIPP